MNALWNKYCMNTKGSFKIKGLYEEGSIVQVARKVKQIYRKVPCDSFEALSDARFKFFVSEVSEL
jgi:hypothetical protein